MGIVWEAAAVFGCLVLSAFFSSSETALTALSPNEAKRLSESGDPTYAPLALWVSHPLRVLTCILIGNNIVNITASALATDLAHQLMGPNEAAIPIAVGVMTFLLLTFGEITPKTIAKARYKELAPRMMWAMRLPYALFWPFTRLFTWLTRKVMRFVGSPLDEDNTHRVTEEELAFLVNLGTEEGSLERDTASLLRSALEYTTTRVREVMIPRAEMVYIEVDWEYARVVETLVASGHSRVPVVDRAQDDVLGLFYAKDLLGYALTNRHDAFDVRRYLRRVKFVPEQKPVSDLLREFQASRIHMAIIVDEFGGIRGLVTLEDIVEEFFGEIRDEYDSEEDPILQVSPGRFEVEAKCVLDDLTEAIGITFPLDEDDDYESLGGFIITRLGKVPRAGAEIKLDAWTLRVIKADAKRVIRVEVTNHRRRASSDDSPDSPPNDPDTPGGSEDDEGRIIRLPSFAS